jgi:signal transduction histidine kinase
MRLYVRAVAMTNSSKVICSSFDGAHIRVAAAEEGAEGEDVDCEDVNITEADIAPVRARRRTSLGQPRRADLAYGSRFGVRPGARKARHNWNDRLARAGVKGYRGVRATGDTTWLGNKKKNDWAHWCDFEDGMNEVFRALASSWAIANRRLAMLCTYPLEGCGAPQILDVVRTHQFVLARRYGNWDILETAGLKQAKAEIQRLNDELEHRVVERTNQLMVASENLREAQAELAHVNRVTAMGQLAASIVHETLQPISAAVTNAHAALRWLSAESPDMEEVRRALDRIVKDGNRASDVIGRLRALSKKTPPQKDSLAINDAVLDVIAVTRGEVVKNGISLQTQLGDGLPIIQADRVQLQQVILNLIINAVEAMNGVDQGSRELLVATAKDAAGGVLVTVRDSGSGLASESLERLFEPFYTTKPSGMGLGLSICRTMVDAHGGRIWASPTSGPGATVQFTLPEA